MEEMLKNYLNYKAEIKTIEYNMKKLEQEEYSAGTSNVGINADIRPKGYMANNNENKVIRHTDKMKELLLKKEALQIKIEMIDGMMNTLNDYYRRIVELKYKYNKTNGQIATILIREERTIRKALRNILNNLEAKYQKIIKSS